MKHPHDAVIRAWLDGKPVECKVHPADKWLPVAGVDSGGTIVPAFSRECAYRIKPETIRYRVALFNGINAKYVGLSYPNDYVGNESDKDFIRWLGDEQEVEV